MKKEIKNTFILIAFILIKIICVDSNYNVNAYSINFGPATYTNGSVTETYTIPCNGTVSIPSGGMITFQVSAFGDILEFITLSASPLPPGATFPTVSGGHAVSSTFTWTQVSSFAGTVDFLLMPYEIVCSVTFDWPLPVELTSFTSVVHGNDVTLNWTTSEEINNSGFNIERLLKSDETGNWITAGSVAGNGNSSVPNNYSYTDVNLNSGDYQYRLKQNDFNGNYEYYYLSNDVVIGMPDKFSLEQNYPNPFNPSTVINFEIPSDGYVYLKVFDISGREKAELINEYRNAGYYAVKFSGSDLTCGVYFYSLTAEINGNIYHAVRKMILLK